MSDSNASPVFNCEGAIDQLGVENRGKRERE